MAKAASAGAKVILLEALDEKDHKQIQLGDVKLEARGLGTGFVASWYILPAGWTRNLSPDGVLLVAHDRLVGPAGVAPIAGEQSLIPNLNATNGGYRGSALTVKPVGAGKLVVCQLRVPSLLAEEPAARYALIQMIGL